MILFYSEYCKHCNVLLETIKRHDKQNIVKKVSIDLLRTLQKPIDPKIQSVPSLLLIDKKEYLFGKAVFDYLLLPNRGVLFSVQNTRDVKGEDIGNNLPNASLESSSNTEDEPLAFTLGTISSEYFSSINEENNTLSDKTYNWEAIEDIESEKKITQPVQQNSQRQQETDGRKKNLPSMEEIMKQRAKDIT